MRDLLNDPTEGLSHPDPIRRSQIQMHKPLPKRFYTSVDVAGEGHDWTIRLDEKAVKTPGKNLLTVTSEAAAELLAAEWRAQGDTIDPATMPVTRLVNTTIDGIASDTDAVLDDIVKFSSSDLLCYRAHAPEGLVTRQSEKWDPVLEWSAGRLGGPFVAVTGIVHQPQPEPTIAAFSAAIRKYDTPLEIAALHTVTTLTGSAILTLAFAEGWLSHEDVWALAHVDEDWTDEHWGRDDEAQLRREKRFMEMRAAANLFQAV